jgi:hypothetical protein
MKRKQKKIHLAKETILSLAHLAAAAGGFSGGICNTVRYSGFPTCDSNDVCDTVVTSIEIGCPV